MDPKFRLSEADKPGLCAKRVDGEDAILRAFETIDINAECCGVGVSWFPTANCRRPTGTAPAQTNHLRRVVICFTGSTSFATCNQLSQRKARIGSTRVAHRAGM